MTTAEASAPAAAAPRAAAVESSVPALLASAIDVTDFHDGGDGWNRLDAFLRASRDDDALRCWFGVPPGTAVASDRETLIARLSHDLARIEQIINEQVNAVIHHPRFQRLEASWRGLWYLAEQRYDGDGIKLNVLNLSRRELVRDLERAIEFDQSQLFHKIYSDRFGTPGGEPFGVVLADYEVCHRTSRDHPDDIALLRSLAQVGAAAFSPIIVGADPAMFGVDAFSDLGQPMDLERVFRQTEYLRWREFREHPDSRFIGLTLPRVLMRRPYAEDGSRREGFTFREQVRGPDATKYLWGNAVYAFGSVLARSFADHAWLANIQGVEQGLETAGLVTGLASDYFGTDRDGISPKYSTDVLITDGMEKTLAEQGFMPLCACKDTEWSAFYSTASVQKPATYDRVSATTNARLSAQLQCIFAVSRFAHYLKVIGRDKIGSFSTPEACRNYLRRWLLNYTINSDDASIEAKAKAPLREADVSVEEQAGRPGHYNCVVHLRPHFQLDHLSMSLRLVTELAPGIT